MADLDVAPEPPQIPLLGEDELKALPTPRPVILPILGALGAVALTVGLTVVAYPEASVPAPVAERVQQAAVSLAPWLVAAPWLRRLDLRRVPWFFLCLLGPLGGYVFAGLVGFRAFSLPYRSWPISYWNEHRARRIASTRTWVLLDASVVPDPETSPSALSRARFWERLLRVAWVLVAGSAVVFRIWRDLLDSYYGGIWMACLLALAVAPFVVAWVLRSRAANPRSA